MITRKQTIQMVRLSTIAVAISALGGCAAMNTAMNHNNLTVESKMSETIFLDPVSSKDKSIFVQVRNTSGKKLALRQEIENDLKTDGWRVVRDIDKAHDMLQVNVLQAGKAKNPESVWSSIAGGYGSSMVAGSLAGLAAGYGASDAGTGLAVGGMVGVGSWVADQLIKDVTYSVITDVQVSTRTKGKVQQSTQASLSQGNSTHMSQTYQQESNWMRYRTRVASVADKMNLKFPEAESELVKNMSSGISGILTGYNTCTKFYRSESGNGNREIF